MSTTESHAKLERIRQARRESDESLDSPEVYTCPIEGCNRTVVGELAHLISHVRQSGDDAHRYHFLTDDLSLEPEWRALGAVAFDSPPSRERESVYAPDDPWGPGAPESES